MKLRFIILLLLGFSTFSTFAQYKGDIRLGVYGQNTVTEHEMVRQFGIEAEYFVLDNFSLIYKYGFGVGRDGEVSGHVNPAVLLFALFVPYYGDALYASILLSEGVSYHFRPLENLEIAPFISPLGAEINFPGEEEFVLSCNAGINIHLSSLERFLKFSIVPSASILYIYTSGNAYPLVGISVNYKF